MKGTREKEGNYYVKRKKEDITEAKIKMKCKINVIWTKIKEKRCCGKNAMPGVSK